MTTRSDVQRLDDNWAVLDELVRRTEALARRGRREQAAVAAMTAATFAWCNPSGIFTSGPLEDVLARLGSTLPQPDGPAPIRTSRVWSGEHFTRRAQGKTQRTQRLPCLRDLCARREALHPSRSVA